LAVFLIVQAALKWLRDAGGDVNPLEIVVAA
jgi:hypothetical protein